MAKKIFRLHKGGKDADSGWFDSVTITSNDLHSIITDSKGVATSIPSPFARIDLVKSAFKWVSDKGVHGQTAHHKLVSDALDVAQLFFLAQQYPEVEIVEWNPAKRLEELKNSHHHKDFGQTLHTYWQEDGGVYNFDKTERLFFILYNQKLVGGTSPSTLFFAAPDANKDVLNMNIQRGVDILLDDEYKSLDEREWSFVRYFFALSKTTPFKDHFTHVGFNEVNEYLEKVKKELSYKKLVDVENLDETSIKDYSSCHVTKSPDNHCDILGIPLGLQKEGEIDSDFVIKSDLSDDKPLVLPYDKFTKKWKYTSEDTLWDGEVMYNKVPYKNTASKVESKLPVQNNHHYWLSAGNFLEDKIVKLPYKLNYSKFTTCGSDNYLLPLSDTFFKYFKSDKVAKYFKLEKLAGGVQAKLSIPVKGGNINFKKIYSNEDIIPLKCHLAIVPFLKTQKIDIDYTIGVLDSRIDRESPIQLTCFENGKKIKIDDPTIRRPGVNKDIKSFYYKTSQSFDSLQLKINGVSAFIVPNMTEYNGSEEVNYSIDFGTTNTHIEYKEGNNAEKPFEFDSINSLWQSLYDTSNRDPIYGQDDSIFEEELIPYKIGKESEINFPLRTAVVYNDNVDFDKTIQVFKHTNNFLMYEKRSNPKSFKINTGLKWSNYDENKDQHLVENYIEYLMLMTLYKTITLGGDPKKTNITWFYPVSMHRYELNIFSQAWEKGYNEVYKVDNTENLRKIPESIAPYLYYKAKYPGLSLSIDIGGGSSDIALFEKEENNPKLISSFKFAGNSIFGDGFPSSEFRNSPENNGYVNSFQEKAKIAVKNFSTTQKKEILDNIINSKKDSADFSSFLFSLEDENGINFNYTKLLQNDMKMKLPILIFAGAIAYYSAKLLQKCDHTQIPDNILFSGTASKSLSIIDPSSSFENISGLFKFVFENVIDNSKSNIKIALEDKPKEITCKGILKAELQDELQSDSVVFWLGAEGDNNWSEVYDKEKDVSLTPKYSEVELSQVDSLIADSIEDFYKLLDGYVQHINLRNSYGIDPNAYDLFKEMRSDNLKSYLKRGLDTFHIDKNRHIEETLFFYPLIGVLNSFAFKLSELK